MDQDRRLSQEQIGILAIGGLLISGLLLMAASESQKNNQLVRPFPNAPPAPVVPDLPDLIAELRQSKTIGEGRARAAIDLLTQRRDQAALFQAQRLYEDAQAEFNGAIDYLKAGLSRRFTDSDVPRIAARMVAGKGKIDRFADWVNDLILLR